MEGRAAHVCGVGGAAEREAQRQHRAALKRQVADDASTAVAEWENYRAN